MEKSTCESYNCDYFERFGHCTCFKYCPKCKRETLHIDKQCVLCEARKIQQRDMEKDIVTELAFNPSMTLAELRALLISARGGLEKLTKREKEELFK